MTPKEVKQAIKDGKEVFFDDVLIAFCLDLFEKTFVGVAVLFLIHFLSSLVILSYYF